MTLHPQRGGNPIVLVLETRTYRPAQRRVVDLDCGASVSLCPESAVDSPDCHVGARFVVPLPVLISTLTSVRP